MEEKYYYWLHNIPGIGSLTLKRMLEIATPRELYECRIEEVEKLLKPLQKEQMEQYRGNWDLDKKWEELKQKQIRLSYHGSASYPEKLKKIPNPPLVLYEKGEHSCFDKPAIAVIGARSCSNYGSLVAKELGKALKDMGIVVVSGMARGIDSICQWAALEHGGESIGVLGSGIEVCYPKENWQLYDRLQKEGCLVSENLPDTQPKAGLFPLRNRIISGLADMVVVVEAREKSGTLITVDMALEQGKEVYVLPGRITDPLSTGCNRLIKQGAGMILSPREFVEEICPVLQMKYKGSAADTSLPAMTKEEQEIYQLLEIDPKSLEEIWNQGRVQNKELTLSQVMEILLRLCMKKIVMAKEQYYYRIR